MTGITQSKQKCFIFIVIPSKKLREFFRKGSIKKMGIFFVYEKFLHKRRFQNAKKIPDFNFVFFR